LSSLITATLEAGLLTAASHIHHMQKRIGRTVSPGEGGEYWVAALLEDGTTGGGSMEFDTDEKAWECIRSGEADRTAGVVSVSRLA
jgi:hypothetical protein